MNRKIACFIFAFMMSSCVACADSNVNKQLKKVTLEEITQVENYNIDDYTNLDLPENIKLKTVDKLYTFSISNEPNNPDESSETNVQAKKNAITLIKNFSGLEVSEDDIEFDTYDDAGGSKVVNLYYFDSPKNISYMYSPGGTFTIGKSDKSEKDVHFGECISHIIINEDAEIHLEKEAEKLSAADAVKICDENVVDSVIDVIPESGLSLYSVSLFKNNDGTYSYYIVYAKEYLGLNLSEAGEYIQVDSGFIKPSYLCVQIDDEGDIYKIMNYYSNVYDESSIQEISPSSYIKLEDALSLLSGYLAKEKKYIVESVSMVYFLPTKMEANTSKLVYTKYIPGYEVVLESRMTSDSNLYPRKTAYIDMQTGDIYVSDPIDFEQYFRLG